MKKYILIIFMMVSFVLSSQQYSTWVSTRDYLTGAISDEFYSTTITDALGNTQQSLPSGIHVFDINQLPLKIGINQVWRFSFGVLCSFSDNLDIDKSEYFVAGYNGTTYKLCIDKVSKQVTSIDQFYFFSVLLPHYVQPSDNTRSRLDLLFKTTDNVFSDAVKQVPEITWRYNYDNNGFKDFPSGIKHNFPMKSTVGDILVNEGITAGKSLKIQAVLDNSRLTTIDIGASPPNTILPQVSTQIFNFNIIDASPQLDNITQSPTTCNTSNDGGFRITLKRDLDPGETLVMTLYDGTDDSILFNQEFTTSLIDNGNGTFSYDWQQDLDPISYRLKYQTHNGSGNIPDTDPSWDSLEFSPIFTVDKPEKVIFTVTNSSDEKCFIANDGYIDVSATREPGRNLFFQLTKDGTVQVFNGSNWVNYTGTNPNDSGFNAFTNATTTRINNLGEGTYRIKVRDSEKCYMK
ncbi:conserved exported hypothetical protein [Tenacibaculum sp. 190524A05c]|uniref:hypothetical protein n=1 Tax=Tenacibaculum platacis TaxID=3137852 RepID=UPI0031FB45A9